MYISFPIRPKILNKSQKYKRWRERKRSTKLTQRNNGWNLHKSEERNGHPYLRNQKDSE